MTELYKALQESKAQHISHALSFIETQLKQYKCVRDKVFSSPLTEQVLLD